MRRLLAAFLLALLTTPALAQTKLELRERWLYCSSNMLVDANVEKLGGLFERAGKAGYNGVVLTDSKFGRLAEMPPKYFQNVEKIKAAAKANGLEIIPMLFASGWANDLLSQDPNLAEGLPVKDALFVVKSGEARLEPDPPVALPGPDQDRAWDFHDPAVTIARGVIRMQPRGGNTRVYKKLKVAPFREYCIDATVSSRELAGDAEIKVLANGKSLSYAGLGVHGNHPASRARIVFNSLDNQEVAVYFGTWGATVGTLEWSRITLAEVGLLNVLRRPGAPLTVKKEDGPVLAEGRDFEPIADPRMGRVPWPGGYDVAHDPPVIKTHLADGTRLRVSYYHPMIIGEGSVGICMSEPKTNELLRDQARRITALFSPKAYFMAHDEIRIANWCDACQKRQLDAGALLADNVRTCQKILKDLNPSARIYVWSDMFDPNHNAHKDYYLVRGDLAGSWEGLDKSTIIVPWYLRQRDNSIKFFADRGHRMVIAGYYDSPVAHIKEWLASAAERPAAGWGVMYTTWQNNYQDLEAFAKAAGIAKP